MKNHFKFFFLCFKEKHFEWQERVFPVPYHGAQGAYLVLHIRIEALDRGRGTGSQEICQLMVRSWSLGDPSIKIIQGEGK